MNQKKTKKTTNQRQYKIAMNLVRLIIRKRGTRNKILKNYSILIIICYLQKKGEKNRANADSIYDSTTRRCCLEMTLDAVKASNFLASHARLRYLLTGPPRTPSTRALSAISRRDAHHEDEIIRQKIASYCERRPISSKQFVHARFKAHRGAWVSGGARCRSHGT